jgi:hypothetical protein
MDRKKWLAFLLVFVVVQGLCAQTTFPNNGVTIFIGSGLEAADFECEPEQESEIQPPGNASTSVPGAGQPWTPGLPYGSGFGRQLSAASNGYYAQATWGECGGQAEGNGNWLCGGGGYASSQAMTYTILCKKRTTVQGFAHVEGYGGAELAGSVGRAWSGASAQSVVRYGGSHVTAADHDAIAISAGIPGEIGVNVSVLGFQTTYVAASGDWQTFVLIDTQAGVPVEGRTATVSYTRQVEFGYGVNLGRAHATATCLTAAKVRFSLLLD